MNRLWILPLLLLVIAGCSTTQVEYIAHRGASGLAPENTVSSALLAWQLGADAVEIDVYLSADNRVVVIHDADTKRVSGVDLKVDQTDARTLRTLDVGAWKDEKYTGEKVPFLEEIVETLPEGKRLFIEIKCGKEIIPHLEKIVNSSGKRRQITIISFHFDVLTNSKKQIPDIPAYWLIGTQRDDQTKEFLPHDPEWITKAKENNIDGLNVHYAGVDEAFMKAIRAAKQDLYVWTINDPVQAKRLIDLGIKGITTDRPSWLRLQLESSEKM